MRASSRMSAAGDGNFLCFGSTFSTAVPRPGATQQVVSDVRRVGVFVEHVCPRWCVEVENWWTWQDCLPVSSVPMTWTRQGELSESGLWGAFDGGA
ncbi:hypothetical protein D9M68_990040 [compost metagenome]